LGGLVSFFGFLLIFSLRCSLPMMNSLCWAPGALLATGRDLTLAAQPVV
jgi:hypothetical protein